MIKKFHQTTSLNAVRRWLQRAVVGLAVISVVMLLLTLRATDRAVDAVGQLATVKAQKKVADTELGQVQKDLLAKKELITNLKKRIHEEASRTRAANRSAIRYYDEAFNRELALQILAYDAQFNPDRPRRDLSAQDVYEEIVACQRWAGHYATRYPRFKAAYKWTIAMKMLWVETYYDRDPPQNAFSALGSAQVLEFDGYGTPAQAPCLYPLLCQLGYKRETYVKTIRLYRDDPDVQVHCMFEMLTRKLRDHKGNVTAAIVAYNWATYPPESSPYWVKYQEVGGLLDELIEKTKKKLK